MATLSLKNVPEEIYEGLRTRASASGRSLRSEVLSMLARELYRDARDPRALLSELRELRAEYHPSKDGPGVDELVRRDRER